MNSLVTNNDDGFSRQLGIAGISSGMNFAKYTAALGWRGREQTALVSLGPVLITSVYDFIGQWVDHRLQRITTRPLPDPHELNSAIPQSEWPIGLNGQPEEPWKLYMGCRWIAENGTSYVYEHNTAGCRWAIQDLQEATVNMRLLRGDTCYPLAELSEKPWDLPTGLTKRPYFNIVGWKTPGNGGTEKPDRKPVSGATLAAAKPKVGFGHMEDVKPVTTAEIVKDEIPY
jgi:hypothetical protein